MKMLLEDWKVKSLSLLGKEKPAEESKKRRFSLETTTLFSDRTDVFAVEFNLQMENPMFDLAIKAIYSFKVLEGEIDNAFKASAFPKINAPAIAFPYLRALVSTVTLQAGYKPIILPSINFTKLKEKKE